ncbi:MAG: hypothetical protein LBB52_05770 [Desulfovibrio sp.]|nr:hypothetical protein [Desulfovibrio sp.]
METENILWGKRDKETGACHPLLAHLADVAAVMERMPRARGCTRLPPYTARRTFLDAPCPIPDDEA